MPLGDYSRILVIGGGGFIGRHLVELLLKKNVSVRVMDRVRPDWIGSDVEFFEGDFSAIHYLDHVMNDCDGVFHLASTTLPASSNADPQFDIATNLSGTVGLLDLAVEKGVKKFIFISSGGTVYGGHGEVPIQESDPTNPLCSYGIVKLAIEKYMRLYHQLYGLDTCSLRLANPYGEYQRVDKAQGAIAVFCDKALRNEPIDIWGDGTIVRDYVYVKDAVKALVLALEVECSGMEINVGAGVGVNINTLLDHIETAVGRPVERNYLPGRSFDIPAVCLDIHVARECLGWNPEVELVDGIGRFIDWVAR